MSFELFDREAAVPPAPSGPVVRVDVTGRLLLNQQAWLFIYQPGRDRWEVSLMFDPETQQAAIRPEHDQAAPGDGTRWELHQMRGDAWPKSVAARLFVEHYRIDVGEYPARLIRGPGPRMVTFGRRRQDLPAGEPDVVLPEDDSGAGRRRAVTWPLAPS